MPASILLALLAATGLLVLAPALVRRYDADERLIADRAASDARVLDRAPTSSTIPRHGPLNTPRAYQPTQPDKTDSSSRVDWPRPPWEEESLSAEDPAGDDSVDSGIDVLASQADTPEPTGVDKRNTLKRPATMQRPSGWERRGCKSGQSVRLESDQPVTGEDHTDMRNQARLRAQRAAWWRARHRKILYVLLALLFLELMGVVVFGPGFWFGVGVSMVLLVAYVALLRSKVLARRRSRAAHPAGAIAAAPRTYVPSQDTAHEVDEAEYSDPEYDDPDEELLEEEIYPDEDEPEPTVRPLRPQGSLLFGDDPDMTDGAGPGPDRRHTGAIRGRSYESPASGH